MAGIGSEAVGGLSALQASRRQRIMDQIAQQERERAALVQDRNFNLQSRQLDQNDQFRRDQLAETTRQHDLADEDKKIGLANTLADQIPPGAELTPTDPAVGMLQTGGRGALLTHQDPNLASTSYTGASTLPGGPAPIKGTLRVASQAAKPEHYVKSASAKQLDTDADNKRQTDALKQAGENQDWKNSIAQELADLKAGQAPKTPDPQPQIFYDGNGKPHAIQFSGGQSREIPLPSGGPDLAGKTSPITTQMRTQANSASRVGSHVEDVQGLIDEADKRGLLGPALGRWSDFLAGSVGSTGNPDDDFLLGELRMGLSNLKSGFAMVHGGARGGGSPGMAARWDKILNSGKMDKHELTGALTEMKKWLDSYASQAPTSGGGTKIKSITEIK